MTKDDILFMQAGPELDDLVIEKVFGWEKVDNGRTSEPLYTWYHTKNGVRYDVTAKAWTFHPSTQISAAFEVMEKMKDQFDCAALVYSSGSWSCYFTKIIPYDDEDVETVDYGYDAPEMPLAICVAALLAVMED